MKPQKQHPQKPKPLTASPSVAAAARSLAEKLRAGRETLGALDFQRAELESVAAQHREKLRASAREFDALMEEARTAAGATGDGWTYDLGTGVFSKAAAS